MDGTLAEIRAFLAGRIYVIKTYTEYCLMSIIWPSGLSNRNKETSQLLALDSF